MSSRFLKKTQDFIIFIPELAGKGDHSRIEFSHHPMAKGLLFYIEGDPLAVQKNGTRNRI